VYAGPFESRPGFLASATPVAGIAGTSRTGPLVLTDRFCRNARRDHPASMALIAYEIALKPEAVYSLSERWLRRSQSASRGRAIVLYMNRPGLATLNPIGCGGGTAKESR